MDEACAPMIRDLRLGVDLVVLLGYFLLIVRVGLTLGKRENNLVDFALGGRAMPWWAVLASIIAAETSAGTFLGTPGEGFALRNYTYMQLALGTILARFIVAFVFLKPFYDLKVCSIYEFLTIRFGEGTKNAASAIFLVTRVLASGARLYIAAIILAVAFQLWTGTPPNAGQQLSLYIGAVTVMTVLTALYTSVGGIKAVIWTDVIQAALMLGSALCALGLLWWMIPGRGEGVARVLHDYREVTFFATGQRPDASFWANVKNVLAGEYTIWAGLIGATFITLATHGTDQDMVQRMLTAPDYRRSRLSLIWSGLADIPIVFLFLSIGLLLSVYYELRPDPQLPEKTNEIFAYFILKELPMGFRGLLVAGIFATAMGSLSAALNALATTFTRDWYLPGRTTPVSEAQAVQVVRRWTGVFAVLMIVVASATAFFVILYPKSRIIPMVLGIFGYTYGSLLGVFLLGLLTRTRGCDRGNYFAMTLGFIVTAWLSGLPNDVRQLFHSPPLPYPDWVPIISFPWRVFCGAAVTFGAAICFRREATGARLKPV